jgi:hypothetical protein
MLEAGRRIFAVDLDGTIAEALREDGMIYYPEIGPLRPGALEALRLMRERGHYVIIWTCRNSREDLLRVKRYLLERGVPFDAVNEHHPDLRYTFGNDTRKIWAHYYIDDRSFGAWTWDEVYRHVEALG